MRRAENFSALYHPDVNRHQAVADADAGAPFICAVNAVHNAFLPFQCGQLVLREQLHHFFSGLIFLQRFGEIEQRTNGFLGIRETGRATMQFGERRRFSYREDMRGSF